MVFSSVLSPVKPVGQQNPIVVLKVLKGQPDVVPGPPDPHRLQHARVPQLTLYNGVVKLAGNLLRVRLDAPDEERVGLVQRDHERVERGLKLGRDRLGLLLGPRPRVRRLFDHRPRARAPVRDEVLDALQVLDRAGPRIAPVLRHLAPPDKSTDKQHIIERRLER